MSSTILDVSGPPSNTDGMLQKELAELKQRLKDAISDLACSHSEISQYRGDLAKMKEREQALALGLLKAKNRLMAQHSSLQQEEKMRTEQDQIQKDLLIQIEKMQKLQHDHQREVHKLSKLFVEKEKNYRQENQSLRLTLTQENQRSSKLETELIGLKKELQDGQLKLQKLDQLKADKEFWSVAYQRLSVDSKEKTTELAIKLRNAYQEIQSFQTHLKCSNISKNG